MYHTQERRANKLTAPIYCTRYYAWLGEAYYFWADVADAKKWGHRSKNGTGYFEVYKAEVDCENVLDTVFNEEHYLFWLTQVEKAAKRITQKTGLKATIKEINQFFKEKANWEEISDGIMFQDLPVNVDLLVKDFYYRKRIQLAVFNEEIIDNFAFLFEGEC